MKVRILLAGAAIALCVVGRAQLPNLNINTADNGSGGLINVGSADNNWMCATSLTGPYNLNPVRVTANSGWHDGLTAPVFPANADWISFPRTCASDPKEDHCNCQPNSPCVDDYYECTFNLSSTQGFVLNLTLMADNCVMGVYLNNTAVYTAPAWQIAAGSPYYGGYLFTGHLTGSEVNISVNSGFIIGQNSLRVHVRSGIVTEDIGWTGLVVFHCVGKVQSTCDGLSSGGGTGDPDGCCLGNDCAAAAQNPLKTDYEIPLDRHDFYFSGDVQAKDKVHVGVNCSQPMPGKLNAFTSVPSDVNGNIDSYSIYGQNTNNADNSTNTGVYGNAVTTNGASGNNSERGVWGVADGGMSARGVMGEASNGITSTGGHFEAIQPNPLGTNYGVYADAGNGNLNYGIYSSVPVTHNTGAGPDWAGYFNGDCFTTANNWYFSDRKLKKDIRPIEKSMDLVKKMNPVTYSLIQESRGDINLSYEKQYGFVSQEIAEVIPELTKKVVHPAKYDKSGEQIHPWR